MATSLADLLDLATDHARGLTPTADTCADLASALRYYGTALARCSIADRSHPGHGCAEDLAAACGRLAASTHQRRQRLGDLAGATADTIAILQPEMAAPARWAATVSIVDAADDLVSLVAGADTLGHLAASTGLRQLSRRIQDTQRLAAAHPPTSQAAAILDRPIPASNPTERHSHTGQHLANAAAGIVHHTRPGQHLALCELLAVTIALESLSETAARLTATLEGRPPDRRAANAWRAAQRRLRPFNDGTRRRQLAAPPLVDFALDLYRALPRPGERPIIQDVRALRDTLHHVPAIGRNLIAAVRRWSETNTLLVYACDIDAGPSHPTEYLTGHRLEGLIPAGRRELGPVMVAIAEAATTTLGLTAGLENYLRITRRRDPSSRLAAAEPREQPALATAPLAPGRPL